MILSRISFVSSVFSTLLFVACSQSGSPTGVSDESPSALAVENSLPDQTSTSVADTSISGKDSTVAIADSTKSDPKTDSVSAPASSPVPVEVAQDVSQPISVPAQETSASVPVSQEPVSTPVPQSPVSEPVPQAPVPMPVAQTPIALPVTQPTVPQPTPDPLVSMPLARTGAQVFLNTDFENESLECWNGNRTATSANRIGCGEFKSIGFTPFSLSETGVAYSGKKAIDITYSKNEEAGGTNVSISADSVNVRSYYYFEPGFDFGQGMKIGRVSSFNSAKQINDVDIILEVRSPQSANQCGVTDMVDVGVFFNGAPKGFDWGNVAANMSFQRGRWYAVEYQVVLNTPGKSNGAVRLWVDGVKVAQRENMNIRGSLTAEAKLNTVKIGGWYSNGANRNTCINPSQPSTLHMDDVAIATSYIGTGRNLTAGNP